VDDSGDRGTASWRVSVPDWTTPHPRAAGGVASGRAPSPPLSPGQRAVAPVTCRSPRRRRRGAPR